MKHIIILGDGMADWPAENLGNKTLLQYAHTPYMDMLAKKGRTGMLKTVPDGFHPGSEVANSSILGYDQEKVYEGRGPLEAASIGVELDPDDMAIRCNLICIEGENIKNHSAGHLKTEEADVLIKFLNEKLGNDKVHFYTGVQYRHLLVIKGGDKRIHCVPPHDVPGQPFKPLLVKPEVPEAEATANLINELIAESQKLLKDHPLNKQREAEGKDPANSIWPWAGGYRPKMVPLTTTYPQIKKGAVITAVDLIRGIGHYAGLRCINVEGATGLADTNYEGKARAALLRVDGVRDIELNPLSGSALILYDSTRLSQDRLIETGCRWADCVRWGDIEGMLTAGDNIPTLYDHFFDAENPTAEHEGYVLHHDYNADKPHGYIKGKHELFPFPDNVTSINPNIVQNPGWNEQ